MNFLRKGQNLRDVKKGDANFISCRTILHYLRPLWAHITKVNFVDTVTRQSNNLRPLLVKSDLRHSDKRDYEQIADSVEKISSSDPRLFYTGRAAGIVVGLCVSRSIPIKIFRKRIRRGDLGKLIETSDPENFFMHTFLAFSSEQDVARIAEANQRQQDLRNSMDCRSGCWMCCANQSNIPATISEFEDVWNAIKDRDLGPKLHPNACPALGSNGKCEAYDVRPNSCRAYISKDVKVCQRILDNKELRDGEGKSLVILMSAVNTYSVLRALAAACNIQIETTDLLTALREISSGKSMDRAIASGSLVNSEHQRINDNSDLSLKSI